jgi:hypothetical protein
MADEISLELEKQIKELNKSLAAMRRVEDPKSRRQVLELLKKEVEAKKALLSQYKQGTKDYRALNNAIEGATDSLLQFERELEKQSKDVLKKYGNTIIGLGEQFIKMGDAQTQGTEKLSYFTKSLEGTALGGLNALAGSLDYNIGIFRLLASTGADFGQNLIALREAARSAQLPLTDFVDLVGNNAQTLAALFGTTNAGIASLSAFSESIRREGIPQLASLGFTTENLNDFLETYLTRQRFQGRLSTMTQQSATQSVISYAKELRLLSRLTGIQAEELDKSIKGQQTDSVFAAYLTKLDDKQAAAAQQLIAVLEKQSPALAESTKNLLATGVPLDELGQKLSALAPGFQDTIIAFRSGRIGLTDALLGIQRAGKGFASTITDPAVLLAGDLKLVGDALLPVRTLSLDLKKAQEEQLKAADPLTKRLAEFEDSTKRLKSAFESIQTSFLNSLGPTLSGFLGGTSDTFKTIADSIAKFTTENPGKTAALFGTVIAAKYGVDFAKEVAIVAAGVKLGMLEGGVLGNLAKATGGLLMGVGRLLPAVGAVAGVGTSIAKLMEDDPQQKKAGAFGLGGAAAGAALGATIGSIIPGLGTIVGGLIGAGLGAFSGQALVERETGGPLAKGQLALVGEKGPELFLPRSAGEVLPLKDSAIRTAETPTVAGAQNNSEFMRMNSILSENLKGLSEVMVKSEKHLNTLVAISAKTEQNTKESKRGLANLSPSLV